MRDPHHKKQFHIHVLVITGPVDSISAGFSLERGIVSLKQTHEIASGSSWTWAFKASSSFLSSLHAFSCRVLKGCRWSGGRELCSDNLPKVKSATASWLFVGASVKLLRLVFHLGCSVLWLTCTLGTCLGTGLRYA